MEIYLVGGAVRDQLLNFPVKEKDWVVVGATPENLSEQGFRPVGKDFPVFLHPETGEEYALARTERKTQPGYQGFVFHTDTNISLEEDLKRRDLTINAMAKDDTGNIIDPYKGQQDLQKRCLRHISDAFMEDPVRVLRTARFAARYHHLGFHLADETNTLMQKMVSQGEVEHLVAERVWQEFAKSLTEKSPAVFLQVLEDCQALAVIFPELKTNPQSIDTLIKISEVSDKPELRFAGLCAALTTEQVKNFCQRLGLANTYKELAILVNQYQQAIKQSADLDAASIARCLKQADAIRKPERFKNLLVTTAAIHKNKTSVDIIEFWQAALKVFQQINPQQLMAEGLEKAALGQAIEQQRIQQISQWLKLL